MAELFRMPQLGSTMEEGTILNWRKKEGEPIRKGEVLLEIETDKASMEVEAPSDSTVRKILFLADAVVPIQKPIAILAALDESIDALLLEAGVAASVGQDPTPAGSTEALHANRRAEAPETQLPGAPLFASPRARRVADEMGIAISALAGKGTGPEGRVIERDVRAYKEVSPTLPPFSQEQERSDRPPRATPLAARMAGDLGLDLGDLAAGLPGSRVRSADILRHVETRPSSAPRSEPVPVTETEIIPFGGMRKRVAENVARSAFSAPHVTLTLEVDMTAAAGFRAQIIPDLERTYQTRLSFTDILVKAVARALEAHRLLNAGLVGDEIRCYRQKNIGVAVALEEGLIVPVVKNADHKSLGAISAELKQLVERARTSTFTPEDLAGGTFTITNLGAFGIDVFDPIIVPGQSAILGVGRIADKPVVINKEITVRSVMNLCLSFDHRILDGAPAARFLQRLKELLENPLLILI